MPKPAPLYIKEADVAALLGHDVGWLHENAKILEEQYRFPKVDPAINMRHRDSIVEWARERNTRPTLKVVSNDRENVDAF